MTHFQSWKLSWQCGSASSINLKLLKGKVSWNLSQFTKMKLATRSASSNSVQLILTDSYLYIRWPWPCKPGEFVKCTLCFFCQFQNAVIVGAHFFVSTPKSDTWKWKQISYFSFLCVFIAYSFCSACVGTTCTCIACAMFESISCVGTSLMCMLLRYWFDVHAVEGHKCLFGGWSSVGGEWPGVYWWSTGAGQMSALAASAALVYVFVVFSCALAKENNKSDRSWNRSHIVQLYHKMFCHDILYGLNKIISTDILTVLFTIFLLQCTLCSFEFCLFSSVFFRVHLHTNYSTLIFAHCFSACYAIIKRHNLRV